MFCWRGHQSCFCITFLCPSLVCGLRPGLCHINLFYIHIKFLLCCLALCFLSLCDFTVTLNFLDFVLSRNNSFFVVVRRAQFDVFVTESCVVAVMLTDCDCEIEHTVSALTQHFLCGKRSPQTELTSLCTAQPQAFYSGWHPALYPLPPLFITSF